MSKTDRAQKFKPITEAQKAIQSAKRRAANAIRKATNPAPQSHPRPPIRKRGSRSGRGHGVRSETRSPSPPSPSIIRPRPRRERSAEESYVIIRDEFRPWDPSHRTPIVAGPHATAVMFAVDRERDGVDESSTIWPLFLNAGTGTDTIIAAAEEGVGEGEENVAVAVAHLPGANHIPKQKRKRTRTIAERRAGAMARIRPKGGKDLKKDGGDERHGGDYDEDWKIKSLERD